MATDSIKTPSEQLAAKIIERLVSEKLLTANDSKKLQPKLASGQLRAEDWRLPIELAEKKEAKP
ncbi:MAG: hypothetical protein PHV34_07690 [Verrucomicrobiae bacterium]|nr:hypothetical protein [Verrucomicrobiae bacterium]